MSNGSVLVVEDQDDLRELMVMALESGGFTASDHASAEAALASLGDAAPSVCVIDAGLPGMDGFALVEELETRFPGLGRHCVLVTGSVLTEPVLQLLGRRGCRVVQKPFRVSQLVEACCDALA